jgi:hypothetical protein
VAPRQFVQDFGLAWGEDHADEEDPLSFQPPLSPHRIAKAGGITDAPLYTVTHPNVGMDAVVNNEPHCLQFVDYLRTSFQWGGFRSRCRPTWELVCDSADLDLREQVLGEVKSAKVEVSTSLVKADLKAEIPVPGAKLAGGTYLVRK